MRTRFHRFCSSSPPKEVCPPQVNRSVLTCLFTTSTEKSSLLLKYFAYSGFSEEICFTRQPAMISMHNSYLVSKESLPPQSYQLKTSSRCAVPLGTNTTHTKFTWHLFIVSFQSEQWLIRTSIQTVHKAILCACLRKSQHFENKQL